MYPSDSWWDDERIRWYSRAAAASSFHRTLADEIEKHITKEEHILELGAGLGYTSEILMNDGYHLIASDKDEKAIMEARRRTGLDGRFIRLDAETERLPEADSFLMIFFGRLKDEGNLDRYLKSAPKLICIVSEHRGQSETLKRFSEPESTISFLSGRHDISYELYHAEASFDQPLMDETEADRFLDRMYGQDAYRYKCFLRKDENGLIFPNRKHFSIFVIRSVL